MVGFSVIYGGIARALLLKDSGLNSAGLGKNAEADDQRVDVSELISAVREG
ncbi:MULTISPECIES: hypothetical protein [Cyanophyceae]|uniref:hypothetical protein n=1 Tax=Cyanophyceae TaxID=3028117 RepID=UPI001684E829|nr:MULTISPECIES: hypothetical protein [Cyanophyceae]MBD1916169.1 hypothetical protein [Phormidium sp. FACHB-77]MBD2031562.1 hypothetical protein [Phormidium sp. FACHB-322]MBD2052811.1 hypothetical protein [Leptolyngbya sp. FACHB-60]